jgi:large subunit ribosomal protein L29
VLKMALKVKEIRQMTPEEQKEKLKELKEELMHERGVSAMGGSSPSPGKIRQIRQSIARILTVMQEEGVHK